MGENSKIEWCDHTFNPWIGCQRVSPGCDHCYAEQQNKFRGWVNGWGPHGERKRTSAANWKKPLQWNKAAAAAGARHRVFCASLADWLDHRAPLSWREDLACLIDATPHLDWLLLTKRPESLSKLVPWHVDDVPSNVWLGITAEDQARLEQRWRYLRPYNAPVKFVSYEPALGPLSLFRSGNPDWVICGGESGPDARPMNPDWARSLRDQCAAEGVPFFFKQWGEWAPADDYASEIQEDFDARGLTDGASIRVGKKAAGALLDGRQHREFPRL